MGSYRAGYTPVPPTYRGSYLGNPSAAAPFTPADVAGLLIRWKGDLVAGSDGDAQAAWANSAAGTGTGPDLAQANGAKQPLLKKAANGINGRNVLKYDGSDDFQSSSYQAPIGAITTFIVFKLASAAPVNQQIMNVADSAGSVSWLRMVNSGGFQPYTFVAKATASFTNTVGIADVADTNAHLLMWTYNNGATDAVGSYTAALDGVTKSVVASGSQSSAAGTKTSLGAFVTAADSASIPAGVSVGEALVYQGVLSAGNSALITTFLRTYYGL